MAGIAVRVSIVGFLIVVPVRISTLGSIRVSAGFLQTFGHHSRDRVVGITARGFGRRVRGACARTGIGLIRLRLFTRSRPRLRAGPIGI